MATENLSEEDQDFLAKIEEELKDRYTEKDKEFMKVFNLEPSLPPIMENWYPPSARRNNSRRYNPYDRPNNRDRGNHGRDSGYHNRESGYHSREGGYKRHREGGHGSHSDRRGYNDYENDRQSGYYNRSRY